MESATDQHVRTAHRALTRDLAAQAPASLALRAMAVDFPQVHGHPNRLPFEGVLTLVDVPSDRAPSGARGHRVILSRAAAEAALPSLLGMAVDYKSAQSGSAGWDGHDARQKVGIITAAELEGNRLTVAGFVFSRDFPEIEQRLCHPERSAAGAESKDLRLFSSPSPQTCHPERAERVEGPALRSPQTCHPERAHSTQTCHPERSAAGAESKDLLLSSSPRDLMGMSYELADAHVADMRAPVWTITRATFTGAAILLREKAAYRDTSFKLQRAGRSASHQVSATAWEMDTGRRAQGVGSHRRA